MKRIAFLVAILLIGCHHRGQDQGPPPDDAPKPDVELLVHNHHWLDINIYLELGNVKQRLGTVTGASDKRFSIPWSKLRAQGGIQLIGDPVGQLAEIETDFVTVRPGAEVVWTIESDLRSSNLAVY